MQATSKRGQSARNKPRDTAVGNWQRAGLSTIAEVRGVLEAVLADMDAAGYPERDVFALRLALDEALVNAVKHGHGGDASKRVEVRYRVDPQRVLVEVEDEGPGFDPHQVADPLDPENLDRPCGRGLLLMRHYLSWFRYNRRGNCVTLCKCRSVQLACSSAQE